MLKIKRIGFSLLLLLMVQNIYSLRPFRVIWLKANCTNMLPSYVTHFTCPIEKLSKNRGNYMDIQLRFSQDVGKVLLEIRVHMPGSNAKDMDLWKFRANGCAVPRNTSVSRNPMVTAMLRTLLQTGNFPDACPLKKDFNYSVNHFALNPDFFPGFTPDMNISATFDLYNGKLHLLSANHFALNPDFFPGFTPDMNISATFDLYNGKLHLLAAEVEAAIRDFDILFNYSNCTTMSHEYVKDFGCPLLAEPRNRGNYLTAYMTLSKDVHKMLLEFRIQVLTTTNATGFATDLLKFRIDGCHVDNYKAPNPIVESMLKKFRSSGNFNGCPLKANFNYTIKYFALNPDYFPPITPEMTFSAIMNMYSEK
uniref:Uncharacterized protein n=1 Tax=Musca domestica TaxID=7370 RepID=A0A1I8N5M4_MUSDO